MRSAAAIAVLGLLLVAPAAHASFPGDNGLLAFEDFAAPDVGSGALTTIVRGAADGGARVRLTRAAGYAAEPAWSADGTRIAYTTAAADELGEEFEHGADLWVMRADGSAKKRITHDRVADFEPAFSPDGRTLAFSSYRARPRVDAEIWTIALRTGRLKRLTRNRAYDSDPEFSPNGRRIVYCSARDVWVMDRDGGHRRRLTTEDGTECGPSWSPDGTQIAFDGTRAGAKAQVFVMDADGSNVRQVTQDPDGARGPAWSPDGTLIAYASGAAIATIAPDGSGRQVVAGPTAGSNEGFANPAWQPVSAAGT
jgi:TolB protein